MTKLQNKFLIKMGYGMRNNSNMKTILETDRELKSSEKHTTKEQTSSDKLSIKTTDINEIQADLVSVNFKTMVSSKRHDEKQRSNQDGIYEESSRHSIKKGYHENGYPEVQSMSSSSFRYDEDVLQRLHTTKNTFNISPKGDVIAVTSTPMKKVQSVCLWVVVPWFQILRMLIPRAIGFVRGDQPMQIAKFGLRWSVRSCVVWACIFAGMFLAIMQYSFFYYISMPVPFQSQVIQFMPSDRNKDILQTEIEFNRYSPQFSNLYLGRESYQIQLQFNGVAESSNNMKGNIYVSGEFKSEYINTKSILVNSMTSLEFKSLVTIYIKEIFKFFPFGNSVLKYVLLQDTNLSQDVTMVIKDEFNNKSFNIKSMELTLHNKYLQYKNAHLKIWTTLSPWSIFGFRYFMRQYFWTVASFVISTLSCINSIFIILAVIFMGYQYKLI